MALSTPIVQEGRNRILPHAAVIFASARILCVAVSGLDSPIHKKTLLQFTFANYQFFPPLFLDGQACLYVYNYLTRLIGQFGYKSFAQYFSG